MTQEEEALFRKKMDERRPFEEPKREEGDRPLPCPSRTFVDLEEEDWILLTKEGLDYWVDVRSHPDRLYASYVEYGSCEEDDEGHAHYRGSGYYFTKEDVDTILRKEDFPKFLEWHTIGFSTRGRSAEIVGYFWDTKKKAFFYELLGFDGHEEIRIVEKERAERLYRVIDQDMDIHSLDSEEMNNLLEATRRYREAQEKICQSTP